MSVDRVEDLECWKLGMGLAKETYSMTFTGRLGADRVLSFQIRKSAVSIPANLAEGFGRSSAKDFAHFVDIARGSTFELATLLQPSSELDYLSQVEYDQLNRNLRILIPKLTALAKYLRRAKSPYR